MKKKMNRFLAMMMALLMVFSWIPVGVIATEEAPLEEGNVTEENAYADATALEFFQYTVTEDGTVVLTKYTGSGKNVIVAPQYTLEGSTYAAILDSATVFKDNTKINTVKLYPGVGFANNTMSYLFYGCSNLVSVDMNGVNTVGVTEMAYMFYKCSKMTTLDMTGIDTSKVTTMYALLYECYKLNSFAGYQDWNTSSLKNIFWMFNKVQGMQVVDLSKWDLSQVINSAWCFQNCYAKQILLPDNLKTMSAGFLNHANSVQGSTFTIPAGVEKIGYAHTIYDFATNDFVEFIVAEGNKNYVAIDGILYSADGKEMLAIPRNKTFENNTFEVPEGVEFFGELSFSRNYNIHTLVLPNSFEIVQNIPLHDPRYIVFEDIGNLNAGNSLSIAMYLYTGVTAYEVKDDNPRYESINGIIYSEDMTTMLAVPTRYNQHIDIPEGVTTIAYEAMWGYDTTDVYLSNSTGINIPSTMTDIAQDQFAKLNRMNKKYAKFDITVHPDNPVYKVDTNGYLMADGQVARNMTSLKAYTSLADALAEIKSGDTIALLDDVVLTEPIVINGGKVTLDLCGKTITATPPVRRITKAAAVTNPAIRIQGGADVTVKNGTIESDSSVFALGATDGSSAGKLTVESGNYTGAASVISVTKGTLNISGGTFKAESEDDTVNLIDANCTDGSAAVSITGGTFYGFDPENFTAEGESSNLCATNYASKDNGDNSWTVETIFAATIVETGESYESLAQAVTAANELESATIQLLKNIDLAEKLTITGNVTIDGSGYTITRADNYTGTLFTVNADATLTLDGGLVIDGGNEWVFNKDQYLQDMYSNTKAGSYASAEADAPVASAVMFAASGTVNLNSVTIQNSYSSTNLFSVVGQLNLNNGALITNNYSSGSHVVADIANSGTLTMNKGSKITQNFGPGVNGAMIRVGGIMNMEGGEICENYGRNSGMIMVHYAATNPAVRPTLTMNGGSICHNYTFQGGWGSAIYVHGEGSGTDFIMNGGEIKDNYSDTATGVVCNADNSTIALNGGTIHCPDSLLDTYPGIMTYGELTIGENMTITGEFMQLRSEYLSGEKAIVNNGSVTVDMLTFHCTKYSTIGNPVVSGNGTWNFGVLQVPRAGITVTLSEGTFLGDLDIADRSRLVITGGTFSDLEAIKYLADGLGLAKNADGTYTVTDQVAEVGGVVYNSVAAAEAAVAAEGGTIKMLAIAPVKTSVIVDQPTVIDLNNNEIYATVDSVYPVFRAVSDVTIQGEGGVDAKTFGTGYAFTVGNSETAGNLTIKSGKHYGSATVASVTKGELNIEGGYFQADPSEGSYEYTLDCDDTAYADGSAVIACSGGTFYGFDPRSCEAENTDTNFCAQYYTSTDNGNTTWTVVPDYVAKIVETGELYQTLAEAVADANALGTATIELLKDSTLGEKLTVTGDVTIDGSGYTITRADDYTGTLFTVNAGSTLTLDGGLVIDGGNAWTYKDTDNDGVADLKALVDDYARQAFTVGQFIDYEPGAPKATAAVFTVLGSMEMKDVLVQNHAGSDSIVELGGNGALTTNKETEFFHNVGVNVIDMSGSSTFNMNGSTIRQNVGSNHGGCVRIWNGTMTMNGGLVEENFTTGQGSFVRLDGGKLIIDDGTVQDNLALPFNSSGNNTGAAIDCKYGHIEMNGGTIQRNYGHTVGGINHIGNSLTITGGSIVDNVAMVEYNGAYHNDIFYACSAAKPATITGGTFTTEIYGACTNTNPEIVQGVTPLGYEEFVIGKDADGNPNLWEVAPGWMITFLDENGNELQYGPVRADTIPVFEGEIESREGNWQWSWDKELAPATEPATYTLVWSYYVAEVVKPGSTEPPVRYTTLADAVAAAEDGDTVRLLADIPMTEKITIEGKSITLDGNGYTITRGKLADDSWYTGSLFAINAGAALTLDGGLAIDGGNAWTYKDTDGDGVPDLKTVVDNYSERVGYAAGAFITKDASDPVATADMFTVNGSLVINDTTIQNHYGGTNANVIHINNGGYLTMNERATLTHNATTQYGTYGTVVYMEAGSTFDMNGGTMSQNVGGHHGACVYMNGGTMTMNGGTVKHNHTTSGHASFVRLNAGDLTINGGEIFENAAFPSTDTKNAMGAVIDNTRQGTVTITDVSIHDNFGYFSGGVNNEGKSMEITGGTFVNNTAWGAIGENVGLDYYNHNDIVITPNTIITGGVFSTEIYGSCTGTDVQDQEVTPYGYEEFVIGKDADGNANLWEVAPGWIITFVDEDGTTVLQTGPVRADTIPVFEGEIESRGENWGWSWDKELAPATEPATYTLVWTHYVAEVVKPGSTEPPVRYTTLKDAIAAAEDGDTVRLLEDIPMAEKLTVDGKAITLDGNGYTITRGKLSNGKWYTGTLFTVNANASLTLDGDIVFDGGNNWTFKEEEYNAAMEYEIECAANGIKPPDRGGYEFATAEAGAPTGTARMFVIYGNFAINNATIQNSFGGGIAEVKANASMSINDGALIQHCAINSNAVVAYTYDDSNLTINEGAKITDNYYGHNGGIFRVLGGTATMNGGEIMDNHGVNTNGTVVQLYHSSGKKSSFIMNGGLICGNDSLRGSGAGWCNAIYLHKGGYMEMHGGTICHNSGYDYGGINTNRSDTQLIITRGNVFYNVQRSNIYEAGAHDIGTGIANTGITGGWFSQDVSRWVPETHAVIVHDFACDEDGTCDGKCECTCGYVCEADSKREHCITLYQVAPVIKVTMDDQVIIEGDEIPELTYTINYGIVELNAVEVEVYPATVENPVVGENVISTSGKLHDKEDEAIYYALKIIPGKLTVLPKPECVEDTIVVDSGLPVSIDVMENDPVPNTDSTLVGLSLTAPADMWPVTDSINQQLADGFVTELETGLKYGTAKVEDGKVIYTTNTMAMDDIEVFYYALQYTGDLYRQGYYYGKVTVIPATTIYYEDNFLEYEAFSMKDDSQADAGEVWQQSSSGELTFPELDADRIYGNNPAYSNSTTYSMNSHYQATVSAEHYGTAKFDFWGTGFDLISACTFDTGVLMVSVYDKAELDAAQGETTAQKMQNATPVAVEMIDTYWGYALNSEGQWVASESSDALYQVPVIKMELPAYGNYTAVITASYAPFFDHNTATANYQLYIDAIRIYDPANDGEDNEIIQDAYVADGEGWPSYYELRNLILSAGTFDSLNEDDEINGIVYIDGNTALGGEAAISDYTNFGPNNELYLGVGQGISFTLPDDDNIDQIHLAMKTLLGSASSAEVKVFAADENINEVEAINLTTATDLYYDISLLAGQTIVIYNASDAAEDLISITNIKITHTAKPTSSEEASPFKVTKRGAALALQSVNSSLPEISDPKATVVSKWNIVLGDDIGANFYVEAPENEAASAVKVTVAGQTKIYDLSALTPNEEGLYRISVNVAAAQMTEDITLQMVADGTEYEPVSYTVQDYAKTILAGVYSDETKNLVKHMLDYGAAAQNYFGVKTDELANAGNEIAYTAQYPAEYPQLAVSGQISGVRFYGASLVFESTVAVRYYFQADSIEGVTFRVNDTEYAAVEKDGMFYVEIPGIAPCEYGNSVVLSAQKDGQIMEVTYSPMTYIIRMSQKGQAALKALMNAMYGYYEAAVAYEQQAN